MKVTQSCPTLCDPMDYIVHGILQAIILECVAIPFSRDVPDPGMEPRSLTSLALAIRFFTTSTTREARVAQLVKNPPAMWETWIRSLGWEDPLEKGKATHSGEFHGLYSPWGHKELDMTE